MYCCAMRPFVRHRKLFKILVPTGLLFVLFVNTGKRITGHENVRCVNGICDDAIDSVQQRVLREFRPEVTVNGNKNPWNNITSVTTRAVHPDIVVYNRVPKCASSTVRFLINKLQRKNAFSYQIHNWPNVKQSLTDSEEEELVHAVTSFDKPVLFLRHLHFVDFGKYNATRPAYINVIRNPVDRFVSHYYFSRYGFYGWTEEKIKKWLWPMPEERRNMSLDDCVNILGAAKCIRDNKENMMDFFCGQDKRCRNRDDWALQRAKENIAQNYVFIGILERLEDSLRVAEIILPKYFAGATALYRRSPNGAKQTRTARKKEPSAKTRNLLKKALHREVDLYEFVQKRFVLQFNTLKARGDIT